MFTDYELSLPTAAEAEGIISVLAGAVLIVAVVALLLAVVMYVLKSLGMYTIAKRRGIGCAWLAWIPVGCEWIAGTISDQYRKTTRGKSSFHRVIMLLVALASIALSVVTSSMIADKAEAFVELIQDFEAVDPEDVLFFLEEVAELFSGIELISLASSVLSVLGVVYWYVSMGDLYASCCPNNGTMLLVLSIIMPVLEPFFIFCNKSKDAGMVPSAPQPVPQPQEPVWEAPQPVVQPEPQPQEPVYVAQPEPQPQEPVWQPAQPEAPAQEPWQAPQTQPEPWDVNPEN